jgi:peptidoglycan/xylan/chitin deacetylase (PgdA/CDA1 family)
MSRLGLMPEITVPGDYDGAMRPALLALSLVVALATLPAAQQPATPRRTMAVTIDDLPWNHQGEGAGFLDAARRGTDAMLAALRAHRVPTVSVVNENKLEAPTADERAARIALLTRWVDAGHVLGNHGYSHRDANALTAEAYLADIAKGDAVTRELMRRRQPYVLYFRHPFTHTGDTLEKRDAITRGLAARGYAVMPHTIENADWLFNVAYVKADAAGRAKLHEAYLAHTAAATAFAEAKAAELFGRADVPQTLLIHTLALNADALDAMLTMFEGRGYRFITLDEALRDKAYATPDGYVGKAGPSWLFRWSRSIAPASSFREDPEVPAWVTALYEAAQRP